MFFRVEMLLVAAVAAHECGHAVQHAKSGVWLKIRSALVPVVNLAARPQQWLFFAAIMALSSGFGVP
ncbi:MAG: zinc metallopeptidase [Saprospiraceae bacterium]